MLPILLEQKGPLTISVDPELADGFVEIDVDLALGSISGDVKTWLSKELPPAIGFLSPELVNGLEWLALPAEKGGPDEDYAAGKMAWPTWQKDAFTITARLLEGRIAELAIRVDVARLGADLERELVLNLGRLLPEVRTALVTAIAHIGKHPFRAIAASVAKTLSKLGVKF